MAISKWIVNVGLIRNDDLGYVRTGDITSAFIEEGAIVLASEFSPATGPQDEDTIVGLVALDDRYINRIIGNVSRALAQDCIAVHALGDRENGALLGPNASKWGDYRPELFKEFANPFVGHKESENV